MLKEGNYGARIRADNSIIVPKHIRILGYERGVQVRVTITPAPVEREPDRRERGT